MPRWEVRQGDSVLTVATTDDGSFSLAVENGPLVGDREKAEETRTAIGAVLLAMDGHTS